MNKLYIVSVGRVKTPFWQKAVSNYRDRLKRGYQITEQVIKDADVALPVEARKKQEGERIIAALPAAATWICLDQHGDSMTSVKFAEYLKLFWDKSRPACFIVGGAYGLSDEVLQKVPHKISFGPMTLPHELAQVVLWEQLFRADSILRRTGYHH